ncbi:hypothetical protein M8J75_016144 [Diaphorina citri]|nr:hypothetical protein M8J75_016144 [Diaphorina citri]
MDLQANIITSTEGSKFPTVQPPRPTSTRASPSDIQGGIQICLECCVCILYCACCFALCYFIVLPIAKHIISPSKSNRMLVYRHRIDLTTESEGNVSDSVNWNETSSGQLGNDFDRTGLQGKSNMKNLSLPAENQSDKDQTTLKSDEDRTVLEGLNSHSGQFDTNETSLSGNITAVT